MGLIAAAVSGASGVLKNSYRDYVYCDALPADVLMAKGQKKSNRKASNKGDDDLLSEGSIIAINEGQCMIVVQQGRIVEVCAEPGEFELTSGEPSIFYGKLGEGIKQTFSSIGKAITFGGGIANDVRVYFFNMKEIIGNKFGTPTPVPFRVVDMNIGLDVDISVRCNGEYSYKIVDPLLFYKNVAGNVEGSYSRKELDSQLKSEFLTALQPAFATISEQGVRYSAVPGHTKELAVAMRDELTPSWTEYRGIEIVKVGINSIAANPEDEERLKTLQMTAVMRDPNMRAANQSMATGDAMRTAAGNTAGAMTGFMGMNMAGNAGASMAQPGMYDGVGQPYQYQNAYNVAGNGGFGNGQQAGGWKCECGAQNTGKFCMNCGKPKPAPAGGWACPKCGAQNTGKFCMECGTPKPAADDGTWTCECGAQNTGKFCMNCGKPRA